MGYLVGRRRGGLDVVVVQELHDVQDRDLRGLRDAEDLAQGRIGEDLLALHQAVGLGVGVDAGVDVLAADLGVLGQAQERLQLVGDLQGDREGLATVALALARALLGLLREAGRQLLDRLGQGRGLNGEGLLLGVDLRQAGDGLVQRRNRLIGSDLRGRSRIRGRRGRSGNDRGGNDGRSDRLRGLGGLRGLGRLGGNGGRRNGGRDGNRLNLGGGLGSGLGGLRGSAHFDVVGGSSGAHGTRGNASPGRAPDAASTLDGQGGKVAALPRPPGVVYHRTTVGK